jgi:hypothetical protein
MPSTRVTDAVLAHLPRPLSWFGQGRAALHGVMETLVHPYRPEKHYMRGPGPKCRAKAREEDGSRDLHPPQTPTPQ